MTTVTFEAVTKIGIVVRTFSDLELARAFVKARRSYLPDLVIEEVTRTETRRAVYRPRLARVA
jgi:hypothetical protein